MTRARDLAAFVSNADGDIKFDTDTLFIDSSTNRVGIGTSTPDYKLEVEEPSASSFISVISGNTNETGVIFGDTDANARGGVIYDNSSNALEFRTNTNSEKMHIASDGKVGIGTNSGTGKLTVQDSSLPKIQANYNGAAHLEFGVGGSGGGFVTTTGHFITFNHQPYANRGTDTNLTERVRIDSTGRVIMGQQPYGQASTNTAEAATGKIQLTSNTNSRGGMTIDTTNDRMTVPVAGAYLCGFHHLGESTGTQVEIRKNGTRVDGTSTQQTSGGNGSFSSQAVIELAASDYIEWWCIAGTSHGNDRYNSMYVVFLG